jgi:hypothetical protein
MHEEDAAAAPVRIGNAAILRGVSGRLLPCGCVAGTYELYDGRLVSLLDGRAASCADTRHREGAVLDDATDDGRP